MQRFKAKRYNRATSMWTEIYRPHLIGRHEVTAGEKVKLTYVGHIETGVTAELVRTEIRCDVMAFYVPYRLVWSQWVDFIGGDVGALPTDTNAWSEVGEHGVPINVLGRRAYRLVYNEFFGDEDFGTDSWYADITAETGPNRALKRLRNDDQFLRNAVLAADAKGITFQAPVVGTNAEIDLNSFRWSMQENNQLARQGVSGDKYVDILQQMGVALDWRVQQAPEFLGSRRVKLRPMVTRITEGAQAGQGRTRWEGDVSLELGDKFFAEHGVILTIMALRPPLFIRRVTPDNNNVGLIPLDAGWSSKDEVFLGINGDVVETIQASRWGAGITNTILTDRLARLRRSTDAHYGNFSAGTAVFSYTPTNATQMVYVVPGSIQPDLTGPFEYMTDGEFSLDCLTPVRGGT